VNTMRDKCVVLKCDCSVEIVDLVSGDEFSSVVRSIIGNYYESVPLSRLHYQTLSEFSVFSCAMLVDDEGKLKKGLDINPIATYYYGSILQTTPHWILPDQYIFGNAMLVKSTFDDIEPFTMEEAEIVKDGALKHREQFIKIKIDKRN